MSCTGVNTEATLGTTSHHILKSSLNTVALRPFGTIATGMIACSVCPAVFLISGPALLICHIRQALHNVSVYRDIIEVMNKTIKRVIVLCVVKRCS